MRVNEEFSIKAGPDDSGKYFYVVPHVHPPFNRFTRLRSLPMIANEGELEEEEMETRRDRLGSKSEI